MYKHYFKLITVFLFAICWTGCGRTGSGPTGHPPAAVSQIVPEATAAAQPSAADRASSLVAISAGAYIVERPSEWMDSQSSYALLDENPNSYWATQRGVTTAQTIVIALAERTILTSVEFDNAKTDTQFTGCSAKDVTVEVSDTNPSEGFKKVAEVSLKDRVNDQRSSVLSEVPGRWVRLTVKNNHSDDADSVIELAEFRAYGRQLTQTPVTDMSGTYELYFTGPMHLHQEGTSLTGCYDSREGNIKGGIEGHIAKFTWYEKSGGAQREMGSGIMILPVGGQDLIGVWWEKDRQELTERIHIGPRKSTDNAKCGGGVEEQLAKDLDEFGRARVYGINFDTDSDKIRDESRPTLEKIVSILKSKADLKITVEGHTDSTSTPQHNQDLSERRAASVKKYLVDAGVDATRLTAAGFGSARPVASNENELGRAQNRRVELAKL